MKNVLITGASRGIGAATALKFAACGYNVALNYNKNESLAAKLKEKIENMGVKCAIVKADVSKTDEVKAMFEMVKSELGEIDVLVNNAGIAPKQSLFTDFSDNDCKAVFDVNVFGMMNCCREVIPELVSRKSGRIINMSSIWGVSGGSCEVIYSASKAAVIGFTKALARELAPSGINVNCVAPGMIETDMNAHLSDEDKKLFCEEIPMQRIGKAEEVADLIYFLANDAPGYMTGQTLTLDGGFI